MLSRHLRAFFDKMKKRENCLQAAQKWVADQRPKDTSAHLKQASCVA
jgi:hypothetical protein